VARIGLIGAGIGIFILAGIGFFAPVAPNGYTTPQLNDLCVAGYFENAWVALGGKMMFGQNWEQLIKQDCENLAVTTGAIYLLGIGGVIVLIVGSVMRGPKILPDPSSTEILKERYAKGEITKEEFEQKKKDLENS